MRTPLLSPELIPMHERDLDAVAALEAQVQIFPWSRGNFVDSIHNGHSLWVCRLGAEIIGFVVWMRIIDEAHLLNIGVHPSHQGKGFGARLLRQTMEQARLAGARTLFLEVRPSNDRAVALYRQFGFRQIGLRRGYYPAIVGREDGLVFDKPLDDDLLDVRA